MPDATERFIAAAVAPLGDNAEMQMMARHHLQEALEQHAGNPGSVESSALEEAADRLRASDQRRRLLRLAVPAALVISAGLFSFTAVDAFQRRTSLDFLSGWSLFDIPEISESEIAPEALPAQRLLLFGGEKGKSEADRMKDLWDSDPTNPAYFAEYARTHLKELRRLPRDFEANAEKLDPCNAYFPALAAGEAAMKCVEDIRTKKVKKGDPEPVPQWRIHDQARLEKALGLLEQAAQMPEWNSYQRKLARARFELLPQPADSAERAAVFHYMGMLGDSHFQKFDLSRAIAARAEQCASTSDHEGFQRLLATWDRIAPRLFGDQSPTLISAMIAEAGAGIAGKNLRATAEILALEEEAARLRDQEAEWGYLRKMRQGSAAADERRKRIGAHGSLLLNLSSFAENYRPDDAPGVSEDSMKPGRLADYELANRAAGVIAWILLGIATLVVWLFRFRGGSLARRLSGRMIHVLKDADRAWIIGGGVVAPFFYLQAVSRLTPLGGRDWRGDSHGMIVPAGQMLACLVLMLGLPVLIARWRLNRTVGRLVWKVPGWKTGLAAMGCAAIALPLYGSAVLVNGDRLLLPNGDFFSAGIRFVDPDIMEALPPGNYYLFIATGLLGVALCWLIAVSCGSLAGSRVRMLRQISTSRELVVAYASALLVTSLALPLYHAAERHWIAKDMLMRITAESAPGNVYEAEIMNTHQDRILKILNLR